jgi:hypothetical protein
MLAVLAALGAMLLAGLEGLGCLVMAAPGGSGHDEPWPLTGRKAPPYALPACVVRIVFPAQMSPSRT